MKIEKILILSDFSEVSIHLLNYGLVMARYLNAQVWVQHVYYIPPNVAGESFIPANASEEYENNIHKEFKELKEKLPLLKEKKATLVVSYGNLVDEMNRWIDQEQIDLVIVSNHGGDFLTNILGSNTVKVIQHAHCPVLSVPEHSSFHPYQRIAWAVDLKQIHPGTWNYLTTFVQSFQAHLDIVHVREKSKKYERLPETMYSGWHAFPHRFFTIFSSDIEKGIEEHIDSYKNDLLVLLPHAHPFFDRLFQKSITRRVAYQAMIPLLTIHE